MAKAKSPQQTTTPPITEPVPNESPNACDNSFSKRLETGAVVDKVDSSSNNGNISISSIDEDDRGNDSSAFESSDSECDDEQIKRAIDQIPRSLQPGSQLVQNGMLAVKGDNGSPGSSRGPNIGSIAVQNSSDITFGNKTYIKGQVVIKNIYNQKNGTINGGFEETDGELGVKRDKKDDPVVIQPIPSWNTSLKTIAKDKPILIVIILVAVMVIITSIVIAITLPDKDLLPGEKPLRIVSRLEWLAQPPRGKLDLLELPVSRVIIAHTATEGCTTQAQCVFMTSKVQEFHMANDSKNFFDIGYNFLVGGDGNAYEGRSWDKVGAHTLGFNNDSICIAFIGTFTDRVPPAAQLGAAKQLISLGVQLGKLSNTYWLYGHRQLAPFESPGRKLYEIIKTWPHWSNSLAPNHWVDPSDETNPTNPAELA